MSDNTYQSPADFEYRAFSIGEAQKLLGDISRSHLYALVTTGKLKLTKLGSRSVVTAQSIRQCLDSGRQP